MEKQLDIFITVKNMIIHLKHNQTFEKNLIFPSDLEYWKLISKNYTQCWTKLELVNYVTTDISKVTCKACINYYEKGLKTG